MIFYLSIFIIGGLIGWLIDTSYRTYYEKRYAPNSWIPYFSLVYGIATILLYFLFTYLKSSIFVHILFGSVLVVLLELISGIVNLIFLERRLWNYSDSQHNFYGIIDIEHSFYWVILVSLYRVVFPYLF